MSDYMLFTKHIVFGFFNVLASYAINPFIYILNRGMRKSSISGYLMFLLIMISSQKYAFSQENEIKDSTAILLIWEIGNKGFEYLNYSINLDSAEYFLKKAIDLAFSTSDYVIDDRVAANYLNLATLYRYIFNYDEAIYCYNKAEEILEDSDPQHIDFARLYHNKGNIYKDKGDYFRAKEYYEFAIDFLTRNKLKYTYEFEFIYTNYIELLLESDLDELAEESLDMIDLSGFRKESFIAKKLHTTHATTYAQLGHYDKAQYHFEEAQKIEYRAESSLVYYVEMLRFFYFYIDFNINSYQYQKAIEVCDQAIVFIESNNTRSTKSVITYQSDILYRSATSHFRLGNLNKALSLVDIGINNIQQFLLRLSFGDVETAEKQEYTTSLPDLYVLKSQILLALNKKTKEFDYLSFSYESYQKAIKTLTFMKLAMGEENSKLFATSQVLEIYYEAIYVARLLFEHTGEQEYLEQSFEFAETSKSFALFSEIKEFEAIEFADLPKELRNREKRIVGEKQYTESQLYELMISEDPDDEHIKSLKEILFHLKEDYDDLIHEIEQNNTKYYDLKYKPKFVTLEEIQDQLPYKDALIEYVLSDTLLITYVIDRKGINAFSQKVEPEFALECLEYYEIMQNQNFSGDVHDTFKRFVRLGRKFYSILIEPCLEYTEKRNLTIVPDGAITFIPFECLVTEDTDTEYINYLTLPYMIKEFSVGYSHSSTLMFTERLRSKSPKKKVLAFAPMYGVPEYELDASLMRQITEDEEFLIPLAGTIKEVQSINETVPSDVYINERATEANFKKNASDYNVLHLAMHTRMQDDDPLYSLLAFSDVGEDSIEDNRLYAYEVYNLKLNAEMAVLSSCNSGFGKMQKGEGMMSLARGFVYAGCPSIVMTLWQVTDKSSSELMTSFYSYLKKGKSKQEAMRHAKMDYLKNADDLTSNPYFWSGFVVLGDSSPIYKKSGFAYWMIVITVFIAGLVYIQYRRSKGQKNNIE